MILIIIIYKIIEIRYLYYYNSLLTIKLYISINRLQLIYRSKLRVNIKKNLKEHHSYSRSTLFNINKVKIINVNFRQDIIYLVWTIIKEKNFQGTTMKLM